MTVRASIGSRKTMATQDKTNLDGGVILIMSGTMRTDPDDAVDSACEVLAIISIDGDTHTAGSTTNGLVWTDNADSTISKPSGTNWQGTGLPDGAAGDSEVATWAIVIDSDRDTEASTTSTHYDVNVGATGSGAPVIMSNQTVAKDATVAILTADIGTPQ